MFKGVNQMLISEIWAKTRNSIVNKPELNKTLFFSSGTKAFADETALSQTDRNVFAGWDPHWTNGLSASNPVHSGYGSLPSSKIQSLKTDDIGSTGS